MSLRDQAEEDGLSPSRDPSQNGRMEKPGVSVSDGKITVVGSPSQKVDLGQIKELMEENGLNPDDWQIKGARVNRWTGFAVIDKRIVKATNHQLRAELEPSIRSLLPLPARPDGPRFTPKPRKLDSRSSRLIAIFPDQQIPYHDRDLEECALGWLEVNKPDTGIWSGDASDLPSASRHPVKPHELETSLQDGIQQTYHSARNYVAHGGEQCEWFYVPGNHEQRLQDSILRLYPQLYGLTRPGDNLSVLSLPFLLRLDELGFTWARDPVYKQDYPYGHVNLGKNLSVYHGWIAKEGAGASSLATLRHLGHSVIVGHTHRQAFAPHTFHESNGELRVLGSWEAGTMARVRGGLGYSVAPDWQQGFMTVRLYPDGMFTANHATYVNGVLMWEGQRYRRGKLQ